MREKKPVAGDEIHDKEEEKEEAREEKQETPKVAVLGLAEEPEDAQANPELARPDVKEARLLVEGREGCKGHGKR